MPNPPPSTSPPCYKFPGHVTRVKLASGSHCAQEGSVSPVQWEGIADAFSHTFSKFDCQRGKVNASGISRLQIIRPPKKRNRTSNASDRKGRRPPGEASRERDVPPGAAQQRWDRDARPRRFDWPGSIRWGQVLPAPTAGRVETLQNAYRSILTRRSGITGLGGDGPARVSPPRGGGLVTLYKNSSDRQGSGTVPHAGRRHNLQSDGSARRDLPKRQRMPQRRARSVHTRHKEQ